MSDNTKYIPNKYFIGEGYDLKTVSNSTWTLTYRSKSGNENNLYLNIIENPYINQNQSYAPINKKYNLGNKFNQNNQSNQGNQKTIKVNYPSINTVSSYKSKYTLKTKNKKIIFDVIFKIINKDTIDLQLIDLSSNSFIPHIKKIEDKIIDGIFKFRDYKDKILDLYDLDGNFIYSFSINKLLLFNNSIVLQINYNKNNLLVFNFNFSQFSGGYFKNFEVTIHINNVKYTKKSNNLEFEIETYDITKIKNNDFADIIIKFTDIDNYENKITFRYIFNVYDDFNLLLNNIQNIIVEDIYDMVDIDQNQVELFHATTIFDSNFPVVFSKSNFIPFYTDYYMTSKIPVNIPLNNRIVIYNIDWETNNVTYCIGISYIENGDLKIKRIINTETFNPTLDTPNEVALRKAINEYTILFSDGGTYKPEINMFNNSFSYIATNGNIFTDWYTNSKFNDTFPTKSIKIMPFGYFLNYVNTQTPLTVFGITDYNSPITLSYSSTIEDYNYNKFFNNISYSINLNTTFYKSSIFNDGDFLYIYTNKYSDKKYDLTFILIKDNSYYKEYSVDLSSFFSNFDIIENIYGINYKTFCSINFFQMCGNNNNGLFRFYGSLYKKSYNSINFIKFFYVDIEFSLNYDGNFEFDDTGIIFYEIPDTNSKINFKIKQNINNIDNIKLKYEFFKNNYNGLYILNKNLNKISDKVLYSDSDNIIYIEKKSKIDIVGIGNIDLNDLKFIKKE